MKKGGILNPAICSSFAELRAVRRTSYSRCRLPVADRRTRHRPDVDSRHPAFARCLAGRDRRAFAIDAVTVPLEIKEFSPRIYQEILKIVGETDVDEVPFHEFKEQALDVKGIIRSAEFSPYASVRIVAGSAF